ncbi:MAG: endonuclease III [Armatimonadetes bacterium]|nr:endonuclease III [Armatimonadota bacterium]
MPAKAAAAPEESEIRRRRRTQAILEALKSRYPDPQIPLHHRCPFELLVATILSAQCTDETVNRVTPELFRRFPTPETLARADLGEVEELIRPTGFYRQKARAIVECSRRLVKDHGGQVPPDMEALVSLPGVGRKTANVLFAAAEIERWPGWPHDRSRPDGTGIVVDTHVTRLSRRLNLTEHLEPDRIEQDLMRLLPPEEWSRFSLRLIYFGREVCTARSPRCGSCPLRQWCPSAAYAGSPPWMAARRTAARRTRQSR